MSIEFQVPVTQEILTKISKLDRFRGQLSNLAAIPGERLERIREAATVQSVASSCRLSGRHVTDTEVAAALRDDTPLGDADAIRGYAAGIGFPFPGPERFVECVGPLTSTPDQGC